jgi:hypothetical protein
MKVGNSSAPGESPRTTRLSAAGRFKRRPGRKWLLLSSILGLICFRLDAVVKQMIDMLSPTA